MNEITISDSDRVAGRQRRDRRKMQARGIYTATWSGDFRRMFARIGTFISLESAAELRAVGTDQAKRFARFALANARRDHERWLANGGNIP